MPRKIYTYYNTQPAPPPTVAAPAELTWTPAMRQAAPMIFPSVLASFLGTDSYTLEFWMNSNGTTGITYYLDPDVPYNRFLLHFPHDGTIYYDSGNISGSGRYSIGAPNNYIGVDTHVALQLDGQNDKMRIFLNGVLYGSDTRSWGRTPTESYLIFPFGQSSCGEIRYWDHVRTPAQIQSTMNISLMGPEPGLKFCYRCDERGPAGTVITDRSGNNYHGAIG